MHAHGDGWYVYRIEGVDTASLVFHDQHGRQTGRPASGAGRLDGSRWPVAGRRPPNRWYRRGVRHGTRGARGTRGDRGTRPAGPAVRGGLP